MTDEGKTMKIIDVLTSPWAIQPEKYAEIIRIYQSRARGEAINIKAVEGQLGFPLDNEQQRYEVIDGVAVIPIEGILAKRMNMLTRISGGSSTQIIMKDFLTAIEDQVVKSVLLLVDSPGGTVDGTQNLADVIYNARGNKPIFALADGMAASAGYWIASAAERVYASDQTAILGSIGVVTSHLDVSKAEEKAGYKTTEIYAGKYKRIVSEFKPLDGEGEQYLQDIVDYVYGIFVDSVARNRDVNVETALKDMADGREFIGQQAIDAGLADGIMSYGELIEMMQTEGGARQFPGFEMKSGKKNKQNAAQTTQQGGAVMGNEKKNTPQVETIQTEAQTVSQSLPALTADDIRREYPDSADAIYQSGIEAGATAERNRIKDVEAQTLPGHEKLIAGLKFDGKTTGPEAAAQVLAAERAIRESRLSALESEAPKPVPPSVSKDDGTITLIGADADEREWNEKVKLRDEFGGRKDAFLAFKKKEREKNQ